jgi:hypothetical protein
MSNLNNTSEIAHLHLWLEENDFKYYTLNCVPDLRIIDRISKKIPIVGVAWRQLFRLSPINIRGKIGLSPKVIDPQSSILLSMAYLELLEGNIDFSFLTPFKKCFDRVLSLKSSNSKNFAIRQNKKLHLKLYKTSEEDISPLLTLWAGELFMSCYEYFGEEEYFLLAKGVRNYFIEEHPFKEDKTGIYFYYSPDSAFKIWNASCEISSFLIKYGRLFSDDLALERGQKGINFILSKQRRDGSWFYGGEGIYTEYIDNFHTAFILKSLSRVLKYDFQDKINKSLDNGLDYYVQTLFKRPSKSTLRPKHFDPRHVPINSSIVQKVDIRDCALSIFLFSELSFKEEKYAVHAKQVLKWTNLNMKNKTTYFCEKTWLWSNRIPYIDSQAWMLLAMAKYHRQKI